MGVPTSAAPARPSRQSTDRGDVGVKDGKIVELGKLSGPAKRTIDAEGGSWPPVLSTTIAIMMPRSPGTRCAPSRPDHGCTTVVFGNCSVSLAPVRPGTEKRVAEFLSYVEAIPMEVLSTVEIDWETVPQYMDRLDQRLGGQCRQSDRPFGSALLCDARRLPEAHGQRRRAQGDAGRRAQGHYDPQGVHIPALWADEKEIFALGDVLREMGTGIIQSGGGRPRSSRTA